MGGKKISFRKIKGRGEGSRRRETRGSAISSGESRAQLDENDEQDDDQDDDSDSDSSEEEKNG